MKFQGGVSGLSGRLTKCQEMANLATTVGQIADMIPF